MNSRKGCAEVKYVCSFLKLAQLFCICFLNFAITDQIPGPALFRYDVHRVGCVNLYITEQQTFNNSSAYSTPTNMVDDQAPSSTSVTNTVFMEQRAMNQTDAQHDNIMQLPTSVQKEMPDEHWMAKQQLSKPSLLRTFLWQVSDTVDTNLFSENFPEVLSSVDSLIQRTLSMYAYFKLSPVFRLQINATQFHQGQLIMSFDPFDQSTDTLNTIFVDRRPLFTRYYATGMPNVKIMASESSPVELHVPYVHPANYLTTNTTDTFGNLGRLRVTVLNQLYAASGATQNVSVSLWVYAADAEVHVPIYYHTPIYNGMTKDAAKAGTNLVGNLLSGNWGKAISDGKKDVSNAIDKYLDYPPVPVSSDNTIVPLENLASSSGVSRSSRLAMNNVCGTILDPAVSGSADDNSDLLKIARTPMLFDQTSWQGAQDPGTVVYSFPVTPAYMFKTVRPGYIQPTFLCYIADAFVQWRGSIQIDLEFIATHFHSGKLLVGFVPNNMTPAPTLAQLSANNPLITVDLQQSSFVSFTIPYVSANPYKLNGLQTTGSASDDAIGSVYIMVQNKLVNAANVVSQVDINLYARGGPDFEVALLNGFDNRLQYFTVLEGVEYQSDTTVGVVVDKVNDTDPGSQAILALGPGLIQPRLS